MSHVQQLVSFPGESADTVLNALPHPVLMVAPDGKIVEANVAAESFFEVSMLLLRRHALRDRSLGPAETRRAARAFADAAMRDLSEPGQGQFGEIYADHFFYHIVRR